MRRRRKSYRTGDILHTEGQVTRVGDSMAITLPAAWCREHGIKVGDTVVKVANSILTIATKHIRSVES